MTILLRENPYNGINAHLHSQFQRRTGRSPSTWSAFHASHIIDLANTINSKLPDNYRAVAEQSLQIMSGGISALRKPDITVYQHSRSQPTVLEPSNIMVAPTWVAHLSDTIVDLEEIEVPAIMIYESVESGEHEDLGNPVTRIELLSPANKLGGSFYDTYRNRRREALQSGLPLVEIDYLHETISPVNGLPAYPDDPDSFPYNIIISDPRLPPTELGVRAYGFYVDEAVPALNIPLARDDEVTIPFDEAYQFTFKVGRWGNQIDYAALPERMETYSPEDQQRIRERVATLQ